MATLVSIGVFPEKKAPRQELESAVLVAGGGLEGDFHAADPERAVSMVEARALDRMAGLKGLCTSKFAANLIVEGLVLSRLAPGQLLRIGDAALRVTQVGKECFAECGMEDRSACPLRSGCAFAVAEQGSRLYVGDTMEL